MMFLEYVALGATLPILSLYLKQHLGFSGVEVGVVVAMSALASSAAPVVTALLADYVLSAERLLTLCHLAAAGLAVALFRQHSFGAVVLVFLAYMLVLRPTIGLTNAVAFHHLADARSTFARIRSFGTFGWIAISLGFSYLWLRGAPSERLPHAWLAAALASLVTAAFALALPRPAPAERARSGIVPREALRVFRSRSVVTLCAVNGLTFVGYQYYYVGAAPFLKQAGFTEHHIMPVLAIGQGVELVMMWLVASAMRTFSMRAVLALGILSEILRFVSFAFVPLPAGAFIGVACHGPSIAFLMTASLIYLDQECLPAARSGAQLLFLVLTFGVAATGGSLLAGITMDAVMTHGVVDYARYWSVPGAFALAALVLVRLALPGTASDRVRS
jgi:hypothetical protein